MRPTRALSETCVGLVAGALVRVVAAVVCGLVLGYTVVSVSGQLLITSAPDPAITLQAYDGTERTTTSTTAVDLSTLVVTIPPADAFIVGGLVRKTSGAIAAVQLGLKVNGTQIIGDFNVSNTDNEAQMGNFAFGLEEGFGAARSAGYTQSSLFAARMEAAGTALQYFVATTYANQLPTATITSITITGLSGNAAVTLGIKDVAVYRVARR